MPPNQRPSVSTLTQRAPPAAYSLASSAGSGISASCPFDGDDALDLGDHADAGRAQRRVGVQRRRRGRGQLLELAPADTCCCRRRDVLAHPGEDLVEHASGRDRLALRVLQRSPADSPLRVSCGRC